MARRFRTRRPLTFDERDFRPVSPLQGGTFTLLPRVVEPRARTRAERKRADARLPVVLTPYVPRIMLAC